MPQMKFGKHAGLDFSEVPEDYFLYLISQNENDLLSYKAELERRKIKVEDSIMNKIVETGSGILANDPSIDKTKLTRARDALKKAITDAAQPKAP